MCARLVQRAFRLISREDDLTTTDKAEKPTIYTESGQLLIDLKQELSDLRSRMSLIEEEQEQSRYILDQVPFHQSLADELIESRRRETRDNRENYQVIADVMHNLKSPVTNVVDSLSGIISEIDDSETQETLRECVKTASTVLNSVEKVETFCLDVSQPVSATQQNSVVNIKNFFRNTVSTLQTKKNPHTLRLLIDKSIPENGSFCVKTVQQVLKNLLREIRNEIPSTIVIQIAIESGKEGYGFDFTDLTVQIESETLSNLTWKETWVESIKANQKKLSEDGFNLLTSRESLRKSGGLLSVVHVDNQVQGFKITLPLTY